ncbi:hypothetical protein D3C80_1774960 [compost metagenome]
MLGCPRIVLEEQRARVAIEGHVEHGQGIFAAVAGQPLVGAAHLHQQLVGLQQTRADEGAGDKADQQFFFGGRQAAHLRGGLVDDSHETAPGYEPQASSKAARDST